MEVSEEENEEVKKSDSVNEVVFGISFFLTYFHLVYRLPDLAIGVLLKFIRTLIHFLAVFTGLDLLFGVSQALPKSMHTIKKSFKNNSYTEYVVCPKCYKLFLYQDCLINNHGKVESKKCDYVEFQNHSLLSKRAPCGELSLIHI